MGPFTSSKENPMSQEDQSQYVRTQEYTSGTVQPHISTFAPLCYDEDGSYGENGISITSHDFQEGDFVCPGFFERVNPECFAHRFLAEDWRYDMRRVAQPILPFLYLGPLACLKDREFLQREGFTLLLAIRNDRSAQARLVSGERAATALGIEADSVDVSGNQELISAFPRAIRRINDHIASPTQIGFGYPIRRKVLVFCESGNERSAAVLMAYLMVMLDLDARSAHRVVQDRRFCVSLEDALRHLLASFGSILEAKKDVERTRRTATANLGLVIPPVTESKKRSLDDSCVNEGDDMDMDEYEELGIGRKPLAPFQDRD